MDKIFDFENVSILTEYSMYKINFVLPYFLFVVMSFKVHIVLIKSCTHYPLGHYLD